LAADISIDRFAVTFESRYETPMLCRRLVGVAQPHSKSRALVTGAELNFALDFFV
jgi:hypothetical protein